MPQSPYPLTIFYDGACRLCSSQMDKFKNQDKHKRLIFVDISQSDFDAAQYGLKGAPFQKYLYARNRNGFTVRGVDAFRWMWRATGHGAHAFIAGIPVIKQLGKLLYVLIARVRYQLFGKKEPACNFHCAKNRLR